METKVVIAFLLVIGSCELLAGLYFAPRTTRRGVDWLIDFASAAHLAFLVKPAIVALTAWAIASLFPEAVGSLAGMPLWAGVLLILIPDEFLHYWYHRKGHEWDWLWKIHRTHHTAPDLNVWVSFRENILWFVLMPNLWYAASFVILGLGEAYVVTNILIAVVDVVSHSGFRLDLGLYRNRFTRPLMWVLERTITLPDTHHAHHGVGPASNQRGNYATLLFALDTWYGTAKFPRSRQREFGLEDVSPPPWYVQLYWPLFREPDAMPSAASPPVASRWRVPDAAEAESSRGS